MDDHNHGLNHNHEHNHNHGHDHDISNVKGTRLFFVVVLNFIITIAQIVGGILSGSLSLISDALHNFTDGIAIIISYLAIKISEKENDSKRTFGYKRASILAALINSSFLIVISFFLLREAYFRFTNPQVINGFLVIWVALIGLIANAIGVILLHRNAKGDMNLKSSYLHLLGDTLSSVGVIIGGILIYFFNVYWVDPLLTVLISLYVLKGSYEIIKGAIQILMQGVPKNLDLENIAQRLQEIDGVENVHHAHIWSLDENNIIFDAHVNIKDMLVSETDAIQNRIEHEMGRFGINHVTIQFEYNGCEGSDLIDKTSCQRKI